MINLLIIGFVGYMWLRVFRAKKEMKRAKREYTEAQRKANMLN